MLKKSIHKGVIKFLNMKRFKIHGAKVDRTERKKKRDVTMQLLEISVIIFYNLKGKTNKQKSKDLNNPINQLRLIDIDRALY